MTWLDDAFELYWQLRAEHNHMPPAFHYNYRKLMGMYLPPENSKCPFCNNVV